jgi:hypothetical protein
MGKGLIDELEAYPDDSIPIDDLVDDYVRETQKRILMEFEKVRKRCTDPADLDANMLYIRYENAIKIIAKEFGGEPYPINSFAEFLQELDKR